MVGFEYDDCCWQVQLLYMYYVDTLVGDIVDFNDPNLERKLIPDSSYAEGDGWFRWARG